MTDLVDGGGGGVRVLINAEDLRRCSTVLKDSYAQLQALANTVANHNVPELPPELAAVPIELRTAGRSVGSTADPFVDLSKELRVRAFWADVADAQSECRSLSSAEIAEMMILMKSGDLLAYGVTSAQAEFAGRMLASQYRETFQNPAKLIELAGYLAPNVANKDFSGAFIESFGVDNLAEVPRVLQAMELPQTVAYGSFATGPHMELARQIANRMLLDNPEYRNGNVLDLLAPFTQALAVATYAGTLSRDRQRELATNEDQWAVATLLSSQSTYGKDFLLDAFKTGVVDRIISDRQFDHTRWDDGLNDDFALPLGWTSDGGGLPRDPKVIILQALARNDEAAAAALTTAIDPVELERLRDLHWGPVTSPADLLLDYGTYQDEGRAVSLAFASANDWLHANGQSHQANVFTLRLAEEVINGERKDMDGLVVGLADDLADHHVGELHISAAAGAPDYADGGAGTILPDGTIQFGTEELTRLFLDVSANSEAQDTLLTAVAKHQVVLIADGTSVDPTGRADWAYQIGSLDRILLNATDLERMGDYDDAIARHERVFRIVGDVVGLMKVNPIADLAIGNTVDYIGDNWPGKPSEAAVDAGNYVAKERMIVADKTAFAMGLYENGRIEISDPAVRAVLTDEYGNLRPYSDFQGQEHEGERALYDNWLQSNDVFRKADEFYSDLSDGMYDRDRPVHTGR